MLLLCAGASPGGAQDDEPGLVPLARIEKIVVADEDRLEATDLEVRIIRAHSGTAVTAKRALALYADDQVITGANVALVLLFQDDAVETEKKAHVGPATQVHIRSHASIFLIFGRVLANVRGFFEVERPEGVLGAQGTEFEVNGDGNGATRLLVLDGTVETRPEGAAPAGETPAPVERRKVGPLQAIAISRGDEAAAPRPAAQEEVRAALDWSTNLLLTGRPLYPRPGTPVYFRSADERDRAFRDARFAAAWDRSPAALATLGDVYCEWGEGAKGLEAYKRAERGDPSRAASAPFVAGMAEAFRLTGRLDEAEQKAQQAVRADPHSSQALVTLGNVRVARAAVARDSAKDDQARELLQSAADAFERAAADTSRPDRVAVSRANQAAATIALADIARTQGRTREAVARLAEAEKTLEAARQADASYPYTDTGLADVYRGRFNVATAAGQRDRATAYLHEAEDRYRRAVASNRAPVAAWTGLGALYTDSGRDAEAVQAYARAVERRPDQPAAYWRLGTAMAKADPQRATPYLRTYLDLEAPALKQGRRGQQAVAVVRDPIMKAPPPVVASPAPRPHATPSPRPRTTPSPAVRVPLITVPNVIGKDLPSALAVLKRAALAGSAKAGRGACVARQTPAAAARVAQGSTVTLYVGACPTTSPTRQP